MENNLLLSTRIMDYLEQGDGQLGVLAEEMENNNPKWTLASMEKYMRDESHSSVALGLVSQMSNKRRSVPHYDPDAHLVNGTINGDFLESAGEESSPSWASSSTGNTPSYSSGGVAFEFTAKSDDVTPSRAPPVITTTSCTPNSTPENTASRRVDSSVHLSLSNDLLSALESDLELCRGKNRKSRKDLAACTKNQEKANAAAVACSGSNKASKLSRLLRRTHSAGCSKDVPGNSLLVREKSPVTKTKSADSAPCSREDSDEKQKRNRKTLAQDMKMRLSFLRRRHTDSSLQPSVRPPPEEARRWAESFQDLINSKYGLALFRAFLSREFCEENIEFWLACEDYKRCRASKLSSKARKIYEDFVEVESPKEVNLESSMRSSIFNRLQNPDRHSFDSAQRRIQGLLEQDAYIRFLQSDLYTELIESARPTNSS